MFIFLAKFLNIHLLFIHQPLNYYCNIKFYEDIRKWYLNSHTINDDGSLCNCVLVGRPYLELLLNASQ